LNGFALLSVILVGAAFAQTSQPAVQSPRDPIRIASLNDGQFRFARGGKHAVYDLQSSISGCHGTLYDGGSGQKLGGSVRVRVLDQTLKAGLWYVLMQVTTNTGCNLQGMCGAGLSEDVIWLKFGAKLKLLTHQAAMVEDCATSTELTRFDGKRIETQGVILETPGGVLSLQSKRDDFEKKTTTVTTVRYDRRMAERGLVVSSAQRPLKP